MADNTEDSTTYTTNYKLTKPGYYDTADIDVLNGNFDAIDSAMATISAIANKVDKLYAYKPIHGRATLSYMADEATVAETGYEVSANVSLGSESQTLEVTGAYASINNRTATGVTIMTPAISVTKNVTTVTLKATVTSSTATAKPASTATTGNLRAIVYYIRWVPISFS